MLDSIINDVERRLERITLYKDTPTTEDQAKFLTSLRNELIEKDNELTMEHVHQDEIQQIRDELVYETEERRKLEAHLKRIEDTFA